MPNAGTGEPQHTHRSARDLDILRQLARRINASDAGAHNNLGVVFYQKGLYEEAIEAFERSLELDPRMEVAVRNLQIAYFHTGYFERLVSQLRERLEEAPHDAEARRRLARAYLYGGDPAASATEWSRLLREQGPDAELLLQLGRAERARGDLDAALMQLRRAAGLEPGNPGVRLQLGELYFQRAMAHEAVQELERALELDDDMAAAWHLLAFVYGDLGREEEAGRAEARALELNPSYGRAETNLSLDRHSAARYDELIGDRAPRPEVAEGALAHYNLGLAFRQRGLFDEALRELELALERGEDAFIVRQAKAETLLLRGASEDAGRLYDELLGEETDSPKLWNERGVAFHQLNGMGEAERHYRRALELDPGYTLARNNLAVVLYHASGASEAEVAFERALQGGRAPGDVYRNLALMQARSGLAEAAVASYRAALEKEPSSAAGWSGLGAALMALSRPDEARTALVRAVELDPKLAEARYHLAFALSAVGDYQGALRETKLALELDPYFPAARFRLLIDLQFEEAHVLAPELEMAENVRAAGGATVESFDFESEALASAFASLQPTTAVPRPTHGGEALEAARSALRKGDLDDAHAHLRAAASAGGDRRELLLLQGHVFLRQGFAGEALERYDTLLAQEGPAGTSTTAAASARGRDALLGRTKALLQLGRSEEARAAGAHYRSLAPEDPEGLRTLAEALLALGDAGAAAAALGEARRLSPADPGLATDLGRALLVAGNLEAAEECLRQAVLAEPDGVAARTALGQVLVTTGRLEAGAGQLREALQLLPSYQDAALALVELELRREGELEALDVLVELLSADPYNLQGLTRLGGLLTHMGRVQDALRAYERVLRFDPHSEAARAGIESLRRPPTEPEPVG